jgi:hypothetical protein
MAPIEESHRGDPVRSTIERHHRRAPSDSTYRRMTPLKRVVDGSHRGESGGDLHRRETVEERYRGAVESLIREHNRGEPVKSAVEGATEENHRGVPVESTL